jgi:hypothetical protein
MTPDAFEFEGPQPTGDERAAIAAAFALTDAPPTPAADPHGGAWRARARHEAVQPFYPERHRR